MTSDYNNAIMYYDKVLKQDSSQIITFIELQNVKRTVCDWSTYNEDLDRVQKIVNNDIKVARKSYLVAWYILFNYYYEDDFN